MLLGSAALLKVEVEGNVDGPSGVEVEEGFRPDITPKGMRCTQVATTFFY